MMLQFYKVLPSSERAYKPFGVAYGPPDLDIFHFPGNGQKVANWQSIDFKLKDGKYPDYLASNTGARLCSEKLKNIIDENKYETDEIQWLDVVVIDESGRKEPYFSLHFPVLHQVVDMEKSLLNVDSTVIRPVLKYELVKDKSIFCIPEKYAHSFYVSKKIRDAIKAADCTGISLSKAKISE